MNVGDFMEKYEGPERRREVHISEAQIDAIAEKAATRAVQKMTDDALKAVGKTVLEKFFTIVGLLTVAALGWAVSKGWIQLPK